MSQALHNLTFAEFVSETDALFGYRHNRTLTAQDVDLIVNVRAEGGDPQLAADRIAEYHGLPKPVKTRNTGMLEGIQCPQCQSLGRFTIVVDAWVHVDDDGIEVSSDYCDPWNEGSYCHCMECGHEGVVADFKSG